MTILDMIKQAGRTCGLISEVETPSAEFANTGKTIYNQIIEQWRNENLLVHAVKFLEFSVSAGTQSYSIGNGGTWDIEDRPLAIDGAMLNVSGVSYVLEILPYPPEVIDMDSSQGIPTKLIYNPSWPLGYVYLLPSPSQDAIIKLTVRAPLERAVSLSSDVNFPEGYEMLMRYTLAMELALAYGMAPSMTLLQRLNQQRALVKGANKNVMTMTTEFATESPSILRGY